MIATPAYQPEPQPGPAPAEQPTRTPALIRDVFAFFRHPKYIDSPGTPTFQKSSKVVRTVRVWSLALLAVLPVACVIATLLFTIMAARMAGPNVHGPRIGPDARFNPNDVVEQLQSQNSVFDLVQNGNPLSVFILAVILAPLIEESAFRLGLKPKRGAVSMGGAFFIYMGLNVIKAVAPNTFPDWLFGARGVTNLATTLAFVGVVAAILWFITGRIGEDRIKGFYDRRFGWLLYGSSIIFATIHAFNYRDPAFWLATPVLVLPQLLLGLTLGYIRSRFGFVYAVGAHALNNFITLTPSLMVIGSPVLTNPNSVGALVTSTVVMMFCGLIFGLLLLNVVWSLLELNQPRPALAAAPAGPTRYG